MMVIRYYVLLISVLFANRNSFAQAEPETQNYSKHSVGFQLCPISFTIWSYPDYKLHPDDQNQKVRSKNQPVLFWPSGLRYTYNFGLRSRFETGISYSEERTTIRRGKYVEDGHQRIRSSIYEVGFIQVPISVILFPYSKQAFKNTFRHVFVKIGIGIDFVIFDRTESSSNLDVDFHSNKPPGGYNFDTRKYSTETYGNKLRFNRISPQFSIGENINFTEKLSINYSFFLFQSESVYQQKNTVENFKNKRFTFLSFGAEYKF